MAEKLQRGATLADLAAVMDRLLAKDGCPWDREQTLETLRPYLVEETYEVLDALERGSTAEHCEELGDLLMQIVFQAAIRERDGEFHLDDVVKSITDKLVRRHPHIFGDAKGVETADQVLSQWEDIKSRERKAKNGVDRTLAGIPTGLPALVRAQKISARAAKVGFDWADAAGCRDKVEEEVEEISAAMTAGDPVECERELGDLLFATVSLARKLGIDAEQALRNATNKFIRRFEAMEDSLAKDGRGPKEADMSTLDALWEAAKRAE